MRIGIVSDTHDQVARTAAAVRLLIAERADVLIHCGDLTGPDIVAECAALPSYYVFGNNDFDTDDLRRAIREAGGTCLEWGGEVEIGGRRIAVAHGDLSGEIRRLTAGSPDYFLYGHSHAAADQREGATRWINPGALHRARVHSVAVLDVTSDCVRFFEIGTSAAR
jgi:putative phosphoesterase